MCARVVDRGPAIGIRTIDRAMERPSTHTRIRPANGLRFRKSMHLFPASRGPSGAATTKREDRERERKGDGEGDGEGERERAREKEGRIYGERLPNEIYSSEQQMRSFRESGHRHSARNARGGENHPGRFSATRCLRTIDPSLVSLRPPFLPPTSFIFSPSRNLLELHSGFSLFLLPLSRSYAFTSRLLPPDPMFSRAFTGPSLFSAGEAQYFEWDILLQGDESGCRGQCLFLENLNYGEGNAT